jgi:hypothetical protein
MNDQAKNSKLGRGLFDLMEESAAAKTITPLSSGGLMRLPVNAIKLGPWQARTETAGADIDQLTQSIRDRGVLHPILVRRAGEGFELIAGRRRLEAAKAAGLQEIPALVREATDQQCAELFLVENLQRKELPSDYRNKTVKDLSQEFGLAPEKQSELLRTELAVPEPPPPPPPPPVEEKPEPAPTPAPVIAAPIEFAASKPRRTGLWLASVAVVAFLLGAGALWTLMGLSANEPPITEPIVTEIAPPAEPVLPELIVPGTRSVETASRRVTLFNEPVFQAGVVFNPGITNVLQLVAEAMQATPNATFRIVGHTSPDPLPNTDVYADNYALGLARAEAVFNFLRMSGGVPTDRLSVTTRGGDTPPWPMDEPGARAKNRTVTIEVHSL